MDLFRSNNNNTNDPKAPSGSSKTNKFDPALVSAFLGLRNSTFRIQCSLYHPTIALTFSLDHDGQRRRQNEGLLEQHHGASFLMAWVVRVCFVGLGSSRLRCQKNFGVTRRHLYDSYD